MSDFDKLQKYFIMFDEDIKQSKMRVAIIEDTNQMFSINRALMKNPGWLGHYNSQHSILLRIKLEEDRKLTKLEAKYFVNYKENFETTKAPSDKLVQAKVDNNVSIQKQKHICSRLFYYDKRYCSIIQSLIKQLDALTVLSNNLRKEL